MVSGQSSIVIGQWSIVSGHESLGDRVSVSLLSKMLAFFYLVLRHS
ncbi:hypothetical protein H6G89_25470 [Oscillatoria sp. FACHB-1407]|nr:hypothetical protein [Oscillatoria sp. FACHB-1407]